MNRSILAARAVEARAEAEAAWAVSCATARIHPQVDAREIFAEEGGPALRAAAEAAWSALLAACEGDHAEAEARFDHYLTRR